MRILNQIVCLLVVLLSQQLLFACKEDSSIAPGANWKDLGSNLKKSSSDYQSVINARASFEGIKFSIEEVKREAATLKIRVKGGCSDSSFKLIWDGRIMESYPAIISMVLTHEDNSENCLDTDTFIIKVDLIKLLGENARLEDYYFQVSNGSIVQDATLNPNGAVSISN